MLVNIKKWNFIAEGTMPQWYYEKKELKNTPSYLAGLDYETETRYRREGARLFRKGVKVVIYKGHFI